MDAALHPQRSTLPPISRLDMDQSPGFKREEADIQAAEAILSIAPHHSAKVTSPYSGPPPPYSASPPRPSHAPPSHPGHSIPPDDKDTRRGLAPIRQSLPSLSEIVGRTEPRQLPERERSPPRSYLRRSASPRASHYAHDSEKARASHRHTLSDNREASPRHRHAPLPTYGPVSNTSPSSPRPQAHGQWSMPPPPPPPPLSASSASNQPPFAPRPSEVSPTWPASQSPAQSTLRQSPSFSAQPFYAQRPEDARPDHTRPAEYVTSYPALATSTLSAPPPERAWPESKSNYADGARKPSGNYSDSVRSQLDDFDLEASLDDVYNYSHTLMQFSQTYKTQVPRAQRSGSLPSSEPSTGAVHDAIRFNQQIQDALSNILRRLEAREAERAERSAQEALEKQKASQKAAEGQAAVASNPSDRRNSTNGGEGKKRRGRAAPPGRCHSCNRAETPEWRRGPDGARTLCNACGLHYAKLTRRYGANKAATGSSSLRQKPMTES